MNTENQICIDIIPTVFLDYNVKQQLPLDHRTTQLVVSRLKHGHIRAMQRINEDEQIHFLMSQLTGLSEADIDELDIEDSAKLSEMIMQFLQSYAKLAKRMAHA